MTWHLVAISYYDGNKVFGEEPDLPFTDLATVLSSLLNRNAAFVYHLVRFRNGNPNQPKYSCYLGPGGWTTRPVRPISDYVSNKVFP